MNDMVLPHTQEQRREWPLADQVHNPATHRVEFATDLHGYNELFNAPVLPDAQIFTNPSADVSVDEQQRNRRDHAADIKELHDLLNHNLEFAFGRVNQEYASSMISNIKGYFKQVANVAWSAASETDMVEFTRGEEGRQARMSALALAHSDGSGRFANPFVQPPLQPHPTAVSSQNAPPPQTPVQQAALSMGPDQLLIGPWMPNNLRSTLSRSRPPMLLPSQQGLSMYPYYPHGPRTQMMAQEFDLMSADPTGYNPQPKIQSSKQLAAQKKANFYKAVGKRQPPQLAGSKHEDSIDLTGDDDDASGAPIQAVKRPRGKLSMPKPSRSSAFVAGGYDTSGNTHHQFLQDASVIKGDGQINFNAANTQEQIFEPSQMITHARLWQPQHGTYNLPLGQAINVDALEAAIASQDDQNLTLPGTTHRDYNYELSVLSRQLDVETVNQFVEERRYMMGQRAQHARIQAGFEKSQAPASPQSQAMYAALQGPAPQARMIDLHSGCTYSLRSMSTIQATTYGHSMLDGDLGAVYCGPALPEFPQSAQPPLPAQTDPS